MTRRAALSYSPTSTRGEYVARVDVDGATDTAWAVDLSGSSIDGNATGIRAAFCVVDNVLNSEAVRCDFGPYDVWVPGYSRRTFRLPENASSFEIAVDADAALSLYFSQHNPNLPDETNQQAIAAGELTLPYRHKAITAGVSQSMTDAAKYLDFFPTPGPNFIYALLPAATCGDGWYNPRLSNRGSASVFVSPFGTETINGVYTASNPLILNPGDSVDLSSDGALWQAHGALTYESANIPITPDTVSHALPHGLGKRPDAIRPHLVNVSAELGYAVGDEIEWDLINVAKVDATGNTSLGFVRVDDFNSTVILANWNVLPTVPNKTSFIMSSITLAKWNLVLRLVANI